MDTTDVQTADGVPTYRDASAPVAARVADLLALMTIEEKLAQLGSAWVFELADHRGFDVARAAPVLADGIGHITRISGASDLGAADASTLANDIQRHLLEHTRLGVPAIVHEEICAGLTAREATVFPQAIGVAATFHPEHNQAITDAIRRQMRAIGAHQGLSPVLDVCRDPRWGRLEETYGEDPYLVVQMGIAFVRGLQGDELADGVVATAKHFVGYGASEGGLNWAPAHLPERELRDVYLRPFEAAVRDGAIASVMNGYHELDGVPCGANHWLLTELLRDEWGFDGTVVSDYFSVRQLESYHHVAADRCGGRRHRPARRPRRRAAGHRLLRHRAPRRARRGRGVDRRRSTSAVARVLDDEVPPRAVRAAVRRRRSRRRAHTHRTAARARPPGRPRQHRAVEERRRAAARRRVVDRGHRAQRRERAQPARRLLLRRPRRVPARPAGEREQPVHDAAPRRRAVGRGRPRSRADRARRAAYRGSPARPSCTCRGAARTTATAPASTPRWPRQRGATWRCS